jgi:hypothetical protein
MFLQLERKPLPKSYLSAQEKLRMNRFIKVQSFRGRLAAYGPGSCGH